MKKTSLFVGIVFAALAFVFLAGCTKTVYEVAPTTEPPATSTTTKTSPTTTAYRPVVTYAPAKNDVDLFIEGIHIVMNDAVYVSDSDLIETGYLVCSGLDVGLSATDIMVAMYESAPIPGNAQDLLVATTVAATTFLCPEWSWIWD